MTKKRETAIAKRQPGKISMQTAATSLVLVAATAQNVLAAVNFTGGASNSGTAWNTGTNWSTGNVPGGSNTGLFADASDPNLNGALITLSLNSALAQLDLGDNSGDTLGSSFSINNQTLTLQTANGLLRGASTTGTQTINSNLALGGSANQTWNVGGSGGSLVVNGVVSGSVGITKTSGGTLELAAANTFAGPFVLQGGTVIADNAASLGADGSDPVQLGASNSSSNASLLLGNGVVFTRNIAVPTNAAGKNATLGAAASATSASFAGTITMNQPLQLSANADATLTLSGNIADGAAAGNTVSKSNAGTLVLSGVNSFGGGFAAIGGTTIVSNNNALGSSPAASVSGVSSTTPAALLTTDGIALSQNITVRSSVNTTGPGGTAQQYGATLGGSAGNSTWNGTVALNQDTAVTAPAGGTVTFNGNIIDGAGGTNTTGVAFTYISSNLTKTGTGTVVFNGQNTYSQTTTVAAGALVINGTATGGGYTVDAAGTLAGDGELNVPFLDVNNGGTLAPTAGATLSVVGNTVLDGTLALSVSSAAAALSDVGTLTLNADASLNLATPATLTGPVYVLASYSDLTGTFGTVTNLPAGYTIDYDYNNADQIALVSTAVPEPATVGLVAAVGVLWARRRRRLNQQRSQG